MKLKHKILISELIEAPIIFLMGVSGTSWGFSILATLLLFLLAPLIPDKQEAKIAQIIGVAWLMTGASSAFFLSGIALYCKLPSSRDSVD